MAVSLLQRNSYNFDIKCTTVVEQTFFAIAWYDATTPDQISVLLGLENEQTVLLA